MNTRFNFPKKIILILLLWAICIYKFYADYDHEYLTDTLIHTSLIIIASVVSAFAFNSDYSRYKQTKSLISFISTATTLVCIAGLLLTTYLLKKQDDTPSVLYATKNTAGLSSISIDFREDNTYKLGVHRFMSADYTRGHYTKKDSFIYLNKADASGELLSNRLVLRTVPVSDSIKKKKQSGLLTLLLGKSPVDTIPKTFLFQINNTGDIVESATVFKIVRN